MRTEARRDQLRCSTAIGQAEWDGFVDSHAEATAYHAWSWRRVFEEAFGHETLYVAALDGEQVVGVLPTVVFRSWLFGRFMVSLPFVNYGGVLATHAAAEHVLLAEAERLGGMRRVSHIELRHVARRFPRLEAKQHKVGMTMALAADPAAAWNALDRKVRNQVRKAQKSGLTAVSGGKELLRDFYVVFAHNMRDLGTPVYPRRFFEEVFEEFPDDMRIVAVRDGHTTVSAGISYDFRDTVEVPWASSLRAYRSSSPNNLLYWTIIEDAIARGRTVIDFGRSTPGEGTYEFKRQWGAVPSPLFWEYLLLTRRELPDQSPHNPRFKQAIELWKRLPVALTTAVGPRIVRSIP